MGPEDTNMDGATAEDRRNDIIEIESDTEDETQIMPVATEMPNIRQTHRSPVNSLPSQNNASETLCNTDDDDELQLLGETVLNSNNAIASGLGNVDANRTGSVGVAQIRPHQPSAAGEEDLVILEERNNSPSFVLNLPGGEHLRISGSPLDQPVRRSFQTQGTRHTNLTNGRRRLLRRTARRASSLFLHPSDDEDDVSDHENTDLLPTGVRLRRQRNTMLQRRPNPPRRQLLGTGEEVNDPELLSLEAQINSFPFEVRSAFDHAQSIHEFRSILQSVDRQSYEQRQDELTHLFTVYRGHVMRSWANDRLRRARDAASGINTRATDRGTQAHNLRYSPTLAGIIARTFNPILGHMHMAYEPGLGTGVAAFNDADEERQTQNIIQMIQEREEREFESRKRKYMEDTKPKQSGYLQKAAKLPDGYSASFDSTPKMNISIMKNGQKEELTVVDDHADALYMDIPACCLCGVELGVGIPDRFQGLYEEDRGVSFEALKAKYSFHCPYQALSKPSVADRDLSRRTYVAQCGHSFCGRCFARIDNARSFNRASKKRLSELKGASNPDNYGPKNCPAKDCNNRLRSRGKMREVYF
ncbi:LAQU0S12e01046g1_1 [Lachancea quebecensis]|uniref:LAQU0S12e01046g1_1 n=1 Tax=Lachancea quebecensis TaxID=1654605 RepID=A0A0P1KV87_9SACH|nr:LAQU0S12e01046g1_1 [Lachancea quebecensis]